MHVITRSCVLFLWMHTVTSVKTKDCTRENFLNGPLYDSNFDTTDLEASYPAGKQVRVGCNVGYSGFFKLICTEGDWLSRGSKCQPRSCGHPGDAQFAEFHLDKGDDFVFGSEVVYICHKGYQMVSRINYRRCMAEGWDGVVPVCEAQRCPVIHFDDNVQVNGDPEEATYGNVVRFSCKSSTEILSGSSEIYCDENGRWSDLPPKCEEIKCTVPEIENGFVPGPIKLYKEHEVLHFECRGQYRRAEDRASKCIKLGSGAEWSPTPVCEPIRCKLPTALKGTTYEPRFRNVFSPSETLTVICGEKYWITIPQKTSAVTTCKDDGEWTVRPICKEVTCSNPRDPLVNYWNDYWRQRITLDDTVSYRCRSGYKSTDGNNRATCTRDGWTPNPLCEEITCNRHEIKNTDIVNDKHTYKYNEKANYVCKDGYEGRFTRTCGESGWTGRTQCTEKLCNKPDINDANIILNEKRSYHHNEEVQFACNDGERRFTVTCEKGDWTGIQDCSACPKAEVPHGFVILHGDKVYYTCDEGYKLFTKGWWGEAKCVDRLWSGLERCIENRECGEIPVIPKGEVTSQQPTVYRDGESVQINCKEGYQAQADRLTCHEGKWSSGGLPLRTICTPLPNNCNPPPKVAHTVVVTSYQKEYLSDSDVTYQCRDKYTMEGEDTIRCKDGEWEKKSITCTPLSCDPPPADAEFTVKGLPENEGPLLPDHIITFSCDDPGKYLNGSSMVKCGNDGHWDNPFPSCEVLASSCDPLPTDREITIKNVPENEGPLLPDHIITFSCDDPGKYLNGSSVLKCGNDGHWDNPFPSCEEKCKLTGVPDNVHIITHVPDNQLRKGQNVTFRCRLRNQFLQGNAEVECLANGQWSHPFPTCGSPAGCKRPPPLADGDTKESLQYQYGHNDRVEYICQNLYNMEGEPYQTCINGEWTGQMRCLKPCTVTEEAMSQRNIAFRYTHQNKLYSAHNDEIHFRCIRGRHDGAVNMRQRCVHGVIHLPTCQ